MANAIRGAHAQQSLTPLMSLGSIGFYNSRLTSKPQGTCSLSRLTVVPIELDGTLQTTDHKLTKIPMKQPEIVNMINRQNEIAERMMQPVFILHGVTYYPDYTERHRWVGPGRKSDRKIYTTAEMSESGARLTTEFLWPRSWTEDVKGWKAI